MNHLIEPMDLSLTQLDDIFDLADKIQDKSNTSLFPNTYQVVIASSQKSQFTEDELTSLANRFTSKNWSLVWS